MGAAVKGESIVGFIAAHRTTRYGCQGELRWIDILHQHRRRGIASELLRQLAAWFVQRNALRVCVDVPRSNAVARSLYTRLGAETLNDHWLVWKNIKNLLEPARGDL